jgi:hypothetical protein
MKQSKQPATAKEPIGNYEQPLTFEKVWQMFQETDRMFKETDKKWQETDRKWQETDKKWQETVKKWQENDKNWLETDRMWKETDKRIKALNDLFTGQWGSLIESLVSGDLVRLLNERNIQVHDVSERREGCYQGTNYEFDLLARNNNELVIVEVKTTLRPPDVKHFLNKMQHVRTWLHEYKSYNIYGAMAYLKSQSGAANMAMNQGLLVIRATGNSARITNKPDFTPKQF